MRKHSFGDTLEDIAGNLLETLWTTSQGLADHALGTSSLNQYFSMFAPTVTLYMVHLLDVLSEITGDDIKASYFWIGRPDVT